MRWSLVALLALASTPAAAQSVFRGPYLNNVTTDAITVLWQSPADTTGVVRYRAPGTAQWSTASSATPARHHEVRLTGLTALTPAGGEIEYELEVGGTTYPGRFRTAVSGAAPFTFVVYGDNRSSPAQHQVVIEALVREMPQAHFAINTGDLVSSGEDEGDWDAFFPVAQPFLGSMPLFVAIGNHEVELTRWNVTKRIFDLPTGGTPAANDESFYRLLYGNVELIVINVEVDSLYTTDLLAGDQEDWLHEVLANPLAGADHRFVFLHQGPYSSKPGRNGNFWLRQWLEEMRASNVDIIFSGHDHYAERGWTQTGIYYVVHGGGGAPLYNTLGPRVTSDHTIVYGETRLGYALVHVDGPRVRVEIKGIGGELVDQFSYGDSAAPQCQQASQCGAPPRYGCAGGAWECHRSACRYTCPPGSSSLITCVTDNACQQQLGASCAGTATCEHPSINPLSWFCACTLPPDCTGDPDCQGRPSPIPGCTGSWACVTEVCEFTTDVCTPVPDGGPIEDGGANMDGSPQSDAAEPIDAAPALDARPSAEAGTPDAPASPDAGATPAADAAAGAADGSTPPAAQEGCNCSASSADGGPAELVWLGLLLGLCRRHRASRS